MAKITGNTVGIPNPITDYAQNDPTKADYIKNRPFKLIPDGVSIDNITEEGCYIGISKASMVTNYSIYYVMRGFVSARVKCVRQFMYRHSGANGNNFSIQQRYLIDGSDSWSSWEDAYKVVTDYDELNNTPVKNISADTNIDDIKEVGCYATNFNDGDDVENGDNCLILVGTYRDGTKTDYTGNWYSPSQLRIANNYLDTPKLEYRKWEEGKQRWTDWEDIYATKTYVDTEIAKIEGGSGENEYFKILPEDADIDALVEEGKYIVDKRIDVADYIETITVRKGVKKYEDFDAEYETIYQVKECFGSNGYEMLIRNKIGDFEWSNWEDAFGGSGGATFFESSAPQIDITLEEEVKNLAISELNGKALADYKFTTMKIVMENAKLTATGTNTEIVIRVNNNILSGCSINAPTTFINNSTKQYWGGYISLPENLYLGGSSASGSDLWRIPIQMPVNTSRAMGYKQIETIYIDSVSATMPIGTKIKIWLK